MRSQRERERERADGFPETRKGCFRGTSRPRRPKELFVPPLRRKAEGALNMRVRELAKEKIKRRRFRLHLLFSPFLQLLLHKRLTFFIPLKLKE